MSREVEGLDAYQASIWNELVKRNGLELIEYAATAELVRTLAEVRATVALERAAYALEAIAGAIRIAKPVI